MTGPKRLYLPTAVSVKAGVEGRPLSVDGQSVDVVRESWLVEDRWWTHNPLRRRYWELVTDRGELIVVFRELGPRGRWFRQRGSL
jgi:hypothetical protein